MAISIKSSADDFKEAKQQRLNAIQTTFEAATERWRLEGGANIGSVAKIRERFAISIFVEENCPDDIDPGDLLRQYRRTLQTNRQHPYRDLSHADLKKMLQFLEHCEFVTDDEKSLLDKSRTDFEKVADDTRWERETYRRRFRRELENLFNSAEMVTDALFDPAALSNIADIAVISHIIHGRHDIAMRNMQLLYSAAADQQSSVSLTDDQRDRMLKVVLPPIAWSLYRLGHPDERRLIADLSDLANRLRDPRLEVARLRHNHFQNVSSTAALTGLELLAEAGLKDPEDPDVRQLEIYSVEEVIHRGGGLADEVPGTGGRLVSEIIESAARLADDEEKLDSNLRYQTVRARSLMLEAGDDSSGVAEARLREAITELDRLNIKARHANEEIPHAQMRIDIELCTAHGMLARLNGNSLHHLDHFEMYGNEALKTSKSFGMPIMTNSHKKAYTKLLPEIAKFILA